jgi:hypothetical protein
LVLGNPLGDGPAPGNYIISGRINDLMFPVERRADSLTPIEVFHHSVNQYRCANLKTLKQKQLQFPAGSTFSFAHGGNGFDQGIGPRSARFYEAMATQSGISCDDVFRIEQSIED